MPSPSSAPAILRPSWGSAFPGSINLKGFLFLTPYSSVRLLVKLRGWPVTGSGNEMDLASNWSGFA